MRHDRVEGRTDASSRPEPARRRFAGSLRGRLLVVALAVIGPLVVGAGLWILLLSRSTGEYEGLTKEVARESAESVRLLRYLSAAEHDGGRYMETGRGEDLRAFRRIAARIDGALRQTENYDEPGEILGLVSIRRPWQLAKDQIEAYQPQRDRAMIDSPGTDREDQFEADVDLAAAGLERLMVSSQEEVTADLAATDRAVRLNWLLGVCGVAVALLLAAFLASRLSKSLVRPLEQLAQAARSLAAGHLGHRVAIDSTSELNEVGGTFNAMAEALQEQREELERHAFADSLTGLANRALFEDRARHALDRLAGRPERVAVLVLDVDGFKLVNDGLGHTCGDALLRHAAERMAGAIRPSDTLARLGADEFAVLLENVRGLDDALGAAERLREAFSDPFVLKGSEVLVTASVGIAMSTESTRDEAELLRRADLAMYRVKRHGRNGCEFFDPAMDDQAADRLEMVNALRRAIDRDELVVHYQPIVDLDTGQMRAAEALLRWNRPGRGLVSPIDFIPLAEETGVIVALGEWVLNQACTEARGWGSADESQPSVTVNVSARQLLDPRFESVVAGALASSGLDPAALVLEVTESSVMQNADVTIAKLDRVSAMGVRIALDDFGEGYSSLGQLRELPIDIIKIARPFVRELAEDDHDPALLRGIIELARSLGLRLVAEGIEQPEQQAILRAFDCTLGQGFLFARPLEPAQLRAMLEESRGAGVGG
jgi:diguanylate cyclase (GGDEF)-like protein